jgi:hypothetical protein
MTNSNRFENDYHPPDVAAVEQQPEVTTNTLNWLSMINRRNEALSDLQLKY